MGSVLTVLTVAKIEASPPRIVYVVATRREIVSGEDGEKEHGDCLESAEDTFSQA